MKYLKKFESNDLYTIIDDVNKEINKISFYDFNGKKAYKGIQIRTLQQKYHVSYFYINPTVSKRNTLGFKSDLIENNLNEYYNVTDTFKNLNIKTLEEAEKKGFIKKQKIEK